MATYTYFYTVSAYSDYNEYFDTAEQGTITEDDWIKYSDGSSVIDDQWVAAVPEGSSSPAVAKNIKIKKGMKISFYLRFYMKKVDGAVTSYFWLTDDPVKKIKVTATNNNKLRLDSGVSTLHAESTNKTRGWIKTKYSQSGSTTYGNTSGDCFVFTMYAKEDNITIANPFTFTAEITPSNYSYGSGGSAQVTDPSSTMISVASQTPSGQWLGVIGNKPAVQITKGVAVPTANSNFLTELQKQTQASEWYYSDLNPTTRVLPKELTSQMQYVYAYDPCTKQAGKAWVGVKWGPTLSADRKKLLIKYCIIYGSKDGQTLSVGTVEKKEQTSGKGYVTAPAFEKALQLVVAARTGVCGSAASGGGGNGGGGDGGDETTVMVRPTPPKDKFRWNPPPHVEARGINFSYRLAASAASLQASGITNTVNNRKLDEAFADAGANLRRGRIFQDAVTAKIMNKTKLSTSKSGKPTKQWGFEFMYNPESIGYETTDGSGIDWTYGSKDKAVVFSGSQNISFELLINRIPDMSYLRTAYGAAWMTDMPTGDIIMSETAAYGRGLDPEEAYGIIQRGTEYDIEFLYRVLTGDPSKNSLLLDDTGYGQMGLTADMGYITKVPVWLYLHENMRLFGSIGSLGVTHIIFDQNMVPMLSRVRITFSRYPADATSYKPASTTETTGN